jgi:hypothetical protein
MLITGRTYLKARDCGRATDKKPAKSVAPGPERRYTHTITFGFRSARRVGEAFLRKPKGNPHD